MAMAVYMLGFNTYLGFREQIPDEFGEDGEAALKRVYEYAKGLL